MRGRSFKLTNTTLSAVVVTMLLLSPLITNTRAYDSGMEVSGAVPDVPGGGVLTGIGVVFRMAQLTDTQVAFTSTILGFAEARGAKITYLWDFGDNSTKSTDKNPIHTYKYSGWNADFNITLEACTETKCAEVWKNVHVIRWSMVYLTIGIIISVGVVATLVLTKERRKGR